MFVSIMVQDFWTLGRGLIQIQIVLQGIVWKLIRENMSLKKEILGFVVHGPIRIHHGNYIHMGRVGGNFPNSFFFFLQVRQLSILSFVGDAEPTLMANSHLLNSIFQLKIIIKF